MTPVAAPFSVRLEDGGDVAVLVIAGDVDLATAPAVQRELDPIAHGALVIDLCETSFMDSTGLHLMLTSTDALAGRLHIACVPGGPVRRLFEVALGTPAEPLKLFPTRAEALAAFA